MRFEEWWFLHDSHVLFEYDRAKTECGCVFEGCAPYVELEVLCPECSLEVWVEALRLWGKGFYYP